MSTLLAYAADPTVRRLASSGGAVKAILAYLLDAGEIDGAVIARSGDGRTFGPECFVARRSEEVLVAETNSVYWPVPPWQAILGLDRKGHYAATLLPCHAAWLANLQARAPGITVRIGLICNCTPAPAWTDRLLAGYGVTRGDVAALAYRGQGWPGSATVRTRDGRRFASPWLVSWGGGPPPAEVHPACRRCPLAAPAAEHCDLIAGDPWLADRRSIGDGKTLIRVTSPAGARAIDRARRAGRLIVEPAAAALYDRQVADLAAAKKRRGEGVTG